MRESSASNVLKLCAGGAAGVDGQSIVEFEADLKRNLYRIWNRMSSGSYFPPAVKAVPIPKTSGGERILGVPTVGDGSPRPPSPWFWSRYWSPSFTTTPMAIGPGNQHTTHSR
jgi:retron-type reverse transcriptase